MTLESLSLPSGYSRSPEMGLTRVGGVAGREEMFASLESEAGIVLHAALPQHN